MSERSGRHAEHDSLERLSDRELIGRFAASGENEAFTVLLSRHARLVFGVCRRILRHHQDAEDAFQATFLVLARKAAKVRWQTSLANWLYTTAYRVALKASAAAQKRREAPMSHEPVAEESALDVVARSAACRALDEELHQLPEKYRAPLVLCHLEGKTRQQAAEELGLSAVVIKGRLQRGRHELRLRLARRGIGLGLSAAGGGLAVTTRAAGAAWVASAGPGVPVELVTATVEGACQFATGGSVGGAMTTQALQLADGELIMLSGTTIAKPVAAGAIAALLVGVSCLLHSDAVFAEKPARAAVALRLSTAGEREDQSAAVSAEQVAFQAGPSESGGTSTGDEDSADEEGAESGTESEREEESAEARTRPQADQSTRPKQDAQDGTTRSVAAIREAWDRRGRSIERLYAAGDLTEYQRKWKAADPTDPFPGPQREGAEFQDVQLHNKYVFAIDGGKLSFAVHGEQWSDSHGLQVPWFYKIAFDGRLGAMVVDSDNVAMPLGDFSRQTEPNELLTHGYHLAAWWLIIDPVNYYRRVVYQVDDMRVSPVTAVRNGRKCVEVVLPRPGGKWIGLLYLDPAREFVPVQFLQVREWIVMNQLDIKCKPHEECGWVLAAWEASQFDEAGKFVSSSSGTATECRVNAKMDDSVFTVEFPVGTHIIERTPAGSKYFLQEENGERSPMRSGQHGAPAGDRIGRKQP